MVVNVENPKDVDIPKDGISLDSLREEFPDFDDKVKRLNSLIFELHRKSIQNNKFYDKFILLLSEDGSFERCISDVLSEDLFAMLHYNPNFIYNVFNIVDHGKYVELMGNNVIYLNGGAVSENRLIRSYLPKEFIIPQDNLDDIKDKIDDYINRAIYMVAGNIRAGLLNDINKLSKELTDKKRRLGIVSDLHDECYEEFRNETT